MFGSKKKKIMENGAQAQAVVIDVAEALLQDGTELPAKRLAGEPQVLTVDWAAAQAQAGPGASVMIS